MRYFPVKIVLVAIGLVLILTAPVKAASNGSSYAVNLASASRPWDEATLARLAKGQDHRIYTTRFEHKGRTWYRLRLGMFATREAANAAKRAMRRRFPDAWVTRVSPGGWDRDVSAARSPFGAAGPAEAPPPLREAESLPPPPSAEAPLPPLVAEMPPPALSAAADSPALGLQLAAQSDKHSPFAPRHESKPPSETRSSSALRHDLNARLQGGYDTNPLKLNRNISGSAYGRAKLAYRMTYRFAHRRNVFIGGEYRGRRYEVSEADRDDGKAELGFHDSSVKLGEGRLRSTVGARYGFRTMTFIDQATGLEETQAGVPIGSRFDADWWEVFARFRDDLTRETALTMEGGAKFLNYRDDFTNLGLDKLDYNEYGVEPGVRQKIGKLTARVKVPLRYREFDDRRADDINGNNIPGTDLKYYYFGVSANIGDHHSKSIRWTVGGDVERRLDNESGFNDRTYYALYGYATIGRRDGNRLGLYLRGSYREYDVLDTTAINENNDGGRRKVGATASITYTNPVNVIPNFPIDLFVRARGDLYDNSDRDYDYSRVVLSAGVRKKL